MIDLHVHSRFSDGSESPETIAAMAKARGISTIALTDHDNTFGMERMMAACEKEGLDLIPGVELSLKDPEFRRVHADGSSSARSPHVLAYWVPLEEDSPFQRALEVLRADRLARNDKMLVSLKDLGFHRVTKERLIEEAGNEANIGRPHFATVMMKAHPELVGEVSEENKSQIFKNYLTAGQPAYHPRNGMTVDEFLEATRGSGALFSIAHPIPNFFDDASLDVIEREMPKVLARYRERGFVGVEAHYGGFDERTRRSLIKMTREAGLVPTGGSDFHGSYKQGTELGHGWHTDNVVPEAILEELRARR